MPSFKSRLPIFHKNLVTLLLFSYPLLAVSVAHWASGIFYLLAATTLCSLRQPQPAFSREEKMLIGIILLYLASTMLSNTLSGWSRPSVRWYGADIRILLAIPLFLFLRNHAKAALALWRGVPIAGLLAGFYTIYLSDFGTIRPGGPYGPIFIGNIAALFAVVSIATLRHNTYPPRIRLPLHFAGAAMGLVAALLSGTRGAWLAAAVALPIALLFTFMPEIRRRKPLAVSGALLFLAFGMIALTTSSSLPVLKPRLEQAIAETQAYLDSGSAEQRDAIARTSVGFRLEQWRGALLIGAEYPFFGVGVGNVGPELNRHIEAGRINKAVYVPNADRPSHLHSGYFDALVFKGGLGLAALLMLLAYPVWLALRKGRKAAVSRGVVIVSGLSFAIFTLTEDPFVRNNFSSMYVVFTISALSLLLNEYPRTQAAHQQGQGAVAEELTSSGDKNATTGRPNQAA